jgi:predicted nucleic acid-binding protein
VSDIWVVNASPVIALAKADQLHLLPDLCRELLVPEAVVAEILAGPPSDPARQALQRGWGLAVAPQSIAPALLEWGLGTGETAVLAVAMERRPATAVLDDAAARTCAKALGIEVIGTLGVVLRAKRKALIPSAADVLKALRMAGLRLDDQVVHLALKGIGETWEQGA